MIPALIVVGALAVLVFLGSLVLGLAHGWDRPTARLLLRIAAALGIVCAVLGVLLAILGP
ncbi:hypothetical protein [Brachybacterium sp. J153]|uniref:hypothetical protein n=1 Tax=Brachybacterium sp. J153 TaxID=3116488 RepID=UPI002E79760A|nr:hypothetical protein [Brachybacterium sp. J153]MEE1617237.1 hypothetical protein [Brachybacterium sp. J153]